MTSGDERAALVARLAAGGFVAPGEEADELLAAAARGADLEVLVARRETGEPLAWITGRTTFCGLEVVVRPGVYVPRPQTEELARRAVSRLPERGVAVDLCTGSGAVAAVLRRDRPDASVVATDLDAGSVACARANGVDARQGDLLDPVPDALAGAVDVVVGVLPYVPTAELGLLQRDTLTFEPRLFYDGGADGLGLVRRALSGARDVLRPGGALLLELGGEQAGALRGELAALGYRDVTVLVDEDGDPRGLEALSGAAAA